MNPIWQIFISEMYIPVDVNFEKLDEEIFISKMYIPTDVNLEKVEFTKWFWKWMQIKNKASSGLS